MVLFVIAGCGRNSLRRCFHCVTEAQRIANGDACIELGRSESVEAISSGLKPILDA